MTGTIRTFGRGQKRSAGEVVSQGVKQQKPGLECFFHRAVRGASGAPGSRGRNCVSEYTLSQEWSRKINRQLQNKMTKKSVRR